MVYRLDIILSVEELWPKEKLLGECFRDIYTEKSSGFPLTQL